MTEEWKKIEDQPNYEVSNLGGVRNARTKVVLKQRLSKLGNYPSVVIRGKSHYVHRLVAIAFVPNPNGYKNVNHKDEGRTNNRADNLEWCTQGYNVQYGTAETRRRETYTKNLSNNSLVKSVAQYDKDGNLLKIWPSMRMAARELGLNHSEISRICHNKRSIDFYGGFKWKFV